MIRLIVNNTEVYLDPKTSIRFDLVHPAFESEYLHASMVYPFDIPAYKNETVFSHSNHIVVNKKYRIYDCIFSFADSINFNGKLVLSKLSKTSFRGSIITNGFSVDSKDILLKDFTFDDDVSLGATTAAVATYIEGIVDDAYPTVNFNFPYINVPLWYGNDNQYNTDFGNYVNSWSLQNQSINVNSINEDPFTDNNHSILPCLYLMYVIKTCFAELGFKISGDFLTHSELSQLIIFNNSPLDLIESKYTVKATNSASQYILSLSYITIQFDDDSTPPNQDPDGVWHTEIHEYTIGAKGYHDFTVTGFAKNRDVGNPFPHNVLLIIRDVTDSITLYSHTYICDSLEEFEIDSSIMHYWFSADRIGNKVIVAAKCWYTDGEDHDFASDFRFKNMQIDVKNTSFCLFNSFKKTLHYADHLPKITFGNMISAISQTFGLFLLFDHQNRKVEIEFLESLIDNPNYIDLTNKYIDGSYEILLKEKKGYSYQFKWDSADFDEDEYYTEYNPDQFIGEYDSFDDLPIPPGINSFAFVRNVNALYYYRSNEFDTRWVRYSYYFPPFVSSPFKSDIQLSLSPLMMHHDENNSAIYPTSLIKCSSPSYATGINKCDLHLLFYRGLGTEDDAYPFATPFAYDRYGSQQWESELRFDGNNGLMKQFLSNWIDFLDNSQEVSMDFDLNLEDLRSIMKLFLPQTGTKIRKILIRSTEYIPKKFSIMLTMKGIRSCQGKLIKKGMIEV